MQCVCNSGSNDLQEKASTFTVVHRLTSGACQLDFHVRCCKMGLCVCVCFRYLGSSFENHTISIFTQYVSGGSLMNLLHQFGPLGEGITAKYTKQLLNAVCYMHENKVVHR